MNFRIISTSKLCLSTAILLSAPTLFGQIVINGNFETPTQTAGDFTAAPAGATWTFVQGGISASDGPWAPIAGAATQFAYLQRSNASMLQTITFADAGDYTLTYLDGTRHANNGDVNYVVTLRSNSNNALAFTVNKSALLGQAFTANTFLMTVPTAGNYTLKFFVESTGFDSDNSGVFDNVSVVSAVPEPSTYAMAFGAISLGLAIWARRKKAKNGLTT